MKKILSQLFALLAVMALGASTASATTNYGIYIGETMITSDNANDVLGDGQFSYYPSLRTLYVNNASLSNDGTLGSGISNREVDGLIIYLVGSSTFHTRMNVINSSKSFTISGTGTLTGISDGAYPLSFVGDGIKCTVNGPTVDLTSKVYYGLNDYYKSATLQVEGSTTSLTLQPAAGYRAINDLSNLVLGSGVYISEPMWGEFSSELKSVVDYHGTEPYKGKVTIGAAYPLYVANTQVTVRNASAITGEGISGSVSYNASSKTLTLNNANIVASQQHNGIQNRIDGLNINVVGTNSINCTYVGGVAMILAQQGTSITGSGKLNLVTENRNYCIRNLSGKNFNIEGPTIIGSSQVNAFDGNKIGALTVKGTDTKITLTGGSGYPTIKQLEMLNLGSGVFITDPYGGHFSSSLMSITTDDTTPYEGTVVISSKKQEAYGVFIGETSINSGNENDVLGNGQFSYDAETKTLTVRNATLENYGSMGSGISNKSVEGLNICLEGNSTFNTRMAVIDSKHSFTISGTGKLTGTSQAYSIYLWGDSLTCTINGPTIDLISNTEPLRDYFETSTLRVEGSTTSLTLQSNNGYPAVNGLANLVLGGGVYICEPFWGDFSKELKSVIDYRGTEPYRGKVTIGAAYRLYLANTQVTVRNASAISGEGISGNVSYDPSTKTLTLDNASIIAPKERNGIQNMGIDGLNIKVVGTNSIDCAGLGGLAMILAQQEMSVTGDGTLNLITEGRHYCIRNLSGYPFTIEGPTINGSTQTAAIGGTGDRGSVVINDTSTIVTLTSGSGYPVIENLGALTLGRGLHITSPFGGFFSTSLMSITTDGTTPYEGTVVISSKKSEEYGLYIGETPVTSDNAGDILGNGQFKYNPETKTLYVTNATLENDGYLGGGIDNREVQDLTIYLEGENTFNTRMQVIASGKSLTISGSGSLKGTANNTYALYLYGDTMTCTVNCPSVELTSKNFFAVSDFRNNATLRVMGETNLILQPGSDLPAIDMLDNLDLGYGIVISEPEGGYFSEELHTITTDGTTPYKGRVHIRYYHAYDLWVGGTIVTTDNADDILGDSTVSFSNNVLYLNNAKIDGNIFSQLGMLNILYSGDCEITGENGIFASGRVLYISGNRNAESRLTINATKGPGITLTENIQCVFRSGIDVTINATGSGIFGMTGQEYVTVENYDTISKIRINPGSEHSALNNIASLNLHEGIYITKPYGAWFDSEMKSITTNGTTPYMGSVYISCEEPQKPAPSDVNGDGVTDVADIGNIIDEMAAGVNPTVAPIGDVNKDGVVDVADIACVIDAMAEQ